MCKQLAHGQGNSGVTRDLNRGRRVLIPSALTTTPPSHTKDYIFRRVRASHERLLDRAPCLDVCGLPMPQCVV